MKKSPGFVKSLNAFRFLWIFLIAVGHLTAFRGAFSKDFSRIFVISSLFPVDFFFLLSGFGLMLSSFKKDPDNNNPVTFRNSIMYGVNRVKKIYPLYIITTLIVFAANIIEAVVEHEDIIKYLAVNLFRLAINAPLLQCVLHVDRIVGAFNRVSWFLSTLFLTYFFCPLFIRIIRKFFTSIKSCFLGTGLSIAMVLVMEVVLAAVERSVGRIEISGFTIGTVEPGILAYTSPFIRIFYVTAGMFVAKIFMCLAESDFELPHATVFETLALLLPFTYPSILRKLSLGGLLNRSWLSIILCSLFIFVYAFDSGKISAFLKNRICQRLGSFAMNFYLLHFFFLTLFSFTGFDYDDRFQATCMLVFDLAASFIFSDIAYRFQSKKK